MNDWNTVVTVHDGGFVRACRLLESMGKVVGTEFYNVLVMRVDDSARMLEWLHGRLLEDPGALACIARFSPMTHLFNFQSPAEFESRAGEIAVGWVPDLAGKGFHVRMRRRGFKGRISSMDEERLLDGRLLEALEKAGAPGRIVFDDPDFIIVAESVGTRAGMSLWSRDELLRFPFLKPD